MASHILTDITTHYQAATSGWYAYLFPIASHLFGALAVIELAWCALWWTLEKEAMSEIWLALVKKVIVMGLLYALLLNAGSWLPLIIRSFMLAGAGASHLSNLYPSDILDCGITLASGIFQPLSHAGLLTNACALLIGGFAAVVVLLSFTVIAAQLVVALIESYIVVSGGILLLGFAGSTFTNKFAVGYVTYAVSVGVKLFVLYLIIGVGATLASDWHTLLATGSVQDFTPFLEVMSGALVFAYLVMAIPAKAESMLMGGSHATFSGLMSAASATMGAAAATAMMPAKMAFGAGSGAIETIKQAAVLAEGHEGNGAMGVTKGVLGASANLATAMAGTATGHYGNTSTAMAHKTRKIQTHQAEQHEVMRAQTPWVVSTPADNSHTTLSEKSLIKNKADN